MSLKLDINEALTADRLSTAITEAGMYRGVITRAEKLLSKKETQGVGFSFKSDAGETATYLDLYTVNADGKILPSFATVSAIMACCKLREANDGIITFEKWDKDAREMVETKAEGYPDLMGKRIGLLLQKELSTNEENGKDTERMVIYGVFEADTGFTASEIISKATKPEKMEKMLKALLAKPVHDRREKKADIPGAGSYQPASSAYDDLSF
jgi:single-strand DNA-binding protein